MSTAAPHPTSRLTRFPPRVGPSPARPLPGGVRGDAFPPEQVPLWRLRGSEGLRHDARKALASFRRTLAQLARANGREQSPDHLSWGLALHSELRALEPVFVAHVERVRGLRR